MTRKGIWGMAMAAVLAFGFGGADAENAHGVRKQLESSLLVTGFVTIAPDGSVRSHEVDPKIQLESDIAKMIQNAAQRWRFEPVQVDGKVVTARVPMSLRLVAKPSDIAGQFRVRIANVQFGTTEPAGNGTLSPAKLDPPEYPVRMLHKGGKGTVYLIVRVGRDGRVLDAEAEQVNLRVVGSSKQMDFMRKQLADASRHAASNWTFNPPTTGIEAKADSWLARVPVSFVFAGDGPAEAGQWDTYVPGPRKLDIPWVDAQLLRTAGNPDALPEGGVYQLGHGARLLNPPGAG